MPIKKYIRGTLLNNFLLLAKSPNKKPKPHLLLSLHKFFERKKETFQNSFSE